jgi:acyl transferase domain-containing protein/NADPH:quinone reductase-like Zn-dependent oxidoreductase/NAD(P)-dependent dehydrogenase (short-subunit alcohol dehydrogenase family)/acyl carrier protein/SAM-dependent methyltransferase
LLLSAWRTAGISGDTLGYIEAHGSATPLGDTIETDGLKEAFKSLPAQSLPKSTVGLGSVKSNLGHLEAAAGLAGLLKAVLCLKKKQLVASINFEQLNPKIDFSGSPFYIVARNQPWIPSEGTGLRRTGVSSFGSGGANAHAVLEEYVPPVDLAAQPSGPFEITLSARTEDRLRASARRLLEYVTALDEGEISLPALAGALARRQTMEVCAHFAIQTASELKASLAALAAGMLAPETRAAPSCGKTAGLPRSQRLHLPPYPFAGTRHWLSSGHKGEGHGQRSRSALDASPRASDPLRRFVEETPASPFQRCFRWRFTGQETFFQDHRVAHQRILPGVACLEMARTTFVEYAGGLAPSNEAGIRFTDVIWLRPVIAAQKDIELQLVLRDGANGRIAYELQTGARGPQDIPIVHNQGTAEWLPLEAVPAIDIKGRKSSLALASVSHDQCYQKLAALGFDYGPTHRGIETLFLGDKQLLARLRPPAQPASSTPRGQERCALDPTLMDAAWQAALFGLTHNARAAASGRPMLPFMVQEVAVRSECLNAVWAWVRPSAPTGTDHQFDVDMCDEQGHVCIQIKGLAFRPLAPECGVICDRAASRWPGELTAMHPAWDVFTPVPSGLCPEIGAHVAIVGGTLEQHQAIGGIYPHAHTVATGAVSSEELATRLGSLEQLDHLVYIAPDTPLESVFSDPTDESRDPVLQVFRLVKALHSLGYGRKQLSWTLVTTDSQPVTAAESVNPAHAAIHGLAGSMAKEHPHWKVRVLDIERGTKWPLRDMFALPFNSQGNALAFRREEWWRPVLIPFHKTLAGPECYRSGGVYVVIGGAGGLGEVWTRMMILRYQASIIWIGRREPSAAIAAKLSALADLGPAPSYIQADAADFDSLRRAYEQIKQKHAGIHGVIHAALVLQDESLVNITEDRFKVGLASKLDVSVRIKQVFEGEPLDFLLFFSSILSFEKAPGQSSYTAGCAFTDAFAARLSREWSCVVKVVNWGYWGSVGAVASTAFAERMARRGFASIEPDAGMLALQAALESTLRQLAIVAGAPTDIQSQVVMGDRVTVYPDAMPECTAALPSLIPDAQVEQLTGGLQTPPGLHRLLLQLLQATLQGLLPRWKDAVTVAELKSLITGPGFLLRWFDQSISVLKDAGLLYSPDHHSITWQRLDSDELWSQWVQAISDAGAPGPQIALLESCLRSLPLVLTGRQPATDLLFSGSNAILLESVYSGNPASDFFNSVVESVVTAWLEARLSQDPSAQIRLLEIGAGTGGTTKGLLPTLDRFRKNIREYCFTDISKAFLIRAEDLFARHYPFVTTRMFDVSEPIASQAIDPDAYDVVIATNVLHATPDIRRALRNTKASMRKNGLLVLNELSGRSLFTHLTFGLLPGWWLYEDSPVRISGCPGLSPRKWAAVLSDEGFRSISFPAESAHGAGQQVVVAESDGIVRQPVPSSPQESRAAKRTEPAATRHTDPMATRPVVPPENGRVTEQMLEDHVKTTIRQSVSDVLRMDEAAIRNDRSFADYGVDSIVGVQLVRQIGEAYGIALPTMAIFDYHNVNSLTEHLLDVYREPVREAAGIRTADVQKVATSSLAPASGDAQAYFRVAIDGPGDISSLRFVEETPQRLGDDDVRVSVRAFALNYADLLCVRGLYPNMPPYPFTPGLEASGVVVETGRAVTSFRPGDAVIIDSCQRMGTHATMVTCSADDLIQKPEDLSFEQACALPIATLTVLDALDRVNVRQGERVLIQTAAGGTGLAAIQLARSRGAEIYATAGSREKLDYLSTLGIRHLINYRENDFEREIERLCGGRGVDVVINTLPGDFIQKGLRCLAPGGRYVELAMMALKSARNIDLSTLRRNQSFISVDLPAMARENIGRIRNLRAEMVRLQKAGTISPTICRVFSFDQLAEAYAFLESRQNIGKIAVRIPETKQYRGRADEGSTAAVHAAIDRPGTLGGTHEPIAVIGMSGRFAASENLDEFWNHLAKGTDLVQKVSRWKLPDTVPDPDGTGGLRRQCTHGSFLTGIDLFDPLFFDISGMEATCMDPQQRLMLEEAWRALEDAGYAGEQIHGQNCGVYVGCAAGDYSRLLNGDQPAQAFWGNHGSVIPARISYFLNLRGPAIAIDTACSSSLVAVHVACQSLRSGETDMALAGGVFIQSTPEFFDLANKAGMLSPTGRCHTFDARADGFVPGEAVAAVVLKRLPDALKDGDHIYAVIRGSATNQDGRSNGITAPSAKSQEALERQVYDHFNLHPSTIQLIEAHGTGTDLGDPIEFEGLNRAFRHYTAQQGFCAIGSVKTNIGHSAMASGIAGLIKLLLSLKHRQMPPSLHFHAGNPKVQLEGSPFYVNTQLRKWDIGSAGVRRAAISSFGFSGTNAHMVIEEAPSLDRQHAEEEAYLAVLSAQSSSQLRQQSENLIAFCESNPELELGNISFTLFVGRRHCTHRLAVVARNTLEFCDRLRNWLKRGSALQVVAGQLETNDPSEDPGLKRHGNECVKASRGACGEALRLENLATVAELFIRGYRLDYQQLFGEEYSRVPLPGYSFAKESYWPAKPEQEALRRAESAAGEWLFLRESSQHVSLPGNLNWNQRVRQCAGMHVFVIGNDDSDKEEMTGLLNSLTEAAGCREKLKISTMTTLDLGDAICPEPPDVVLMFAPRRSQAGAETIDSAGIRDVFDLSQWLMRCAWEKPVRLYYLYESTILQPRPHCEALSGFMRSAMLENERHVWTLVAAFDEPLANSRSQMLVREWLCSDSEFNAGSFREVRYISSERRIAELVETTLHLPVQPLFRPDRTYIVTGGLGPVGALLCEEMARRYRCTLVILSRHEWDAATQEKCQRLKALGSKVHYYAVDITIRSALQEVWGRIKSQAGAIHGVFHLARLVEDGLIVQKSRDSFRRVCAPKVDGTVNLDEITAGERLDFFALFSSMAAYGIRGSADYGYSAAFQNTFASQRNRMVERGERTGNTVSLCWGPWSVDKYMPANRDENLRKAGYGFIGIEDGLPYIEAACSSGHAVLGLMKVADRSLICERFVLNRLPATPSPDKSANRLTERLAEWEHQKATGVSELVPPIHEIVSADEIETLDPLLLDRLHRLLVDESELSPSPEISGVDTHAKPSVFVSNGNNPDVRQNVVEVVTEVLKVKTIDDTRSFQSYGLDSISATRIAARLERRLKRVVPPSWLIDCPNVERLSAHLENVDRAVAQ